MMRLTAMLSFPAMFGLAMVAEEFILITIHEQWLSSVPLLRILCIGGAFMPLYTLYQNLMISRGRSDIYLWCTVVQIVIQIAIVVAFAKFDMQAMVWAYTAGNILFIGVWQYFLNRLTGIRAVEIMRDICPFMLSAVAVMAVTWPVTSPISNLWLLLICRIVLAAVLYLGIIRMVHAEILNEGIEFIKNKIKRKQR